MKLWPVCLLLVGTVWCQRDPFAPLAPEEPAVKKQIATPERFDYGLHGVVIGETSSYACLSHAGAMIVAKLKDKVDEWVVDSITLDAVELSRGNEKKRLTVDIKTSTEPQS